MDSEAREWTAWKLGQCCFAMMGPVLAMDDEGPGGKAKQDWHMALEQATGLARSLKVDADFTELLECASVAKHSVMAGILERVVDQAEKNHGESVADLLRLGNLAAACLAYGTRSNHVAPIKLGFHAVSERLGIPESIVSGYLDDPKRNLDTFAAIAVQRTIGTRRSTDDVVEVKPGIWGIRINVTELIRRFHRWLRRLGR